MKCQSSTINNRLEDCSYKMNSSRQMRNTSSSKELSTTMINKALLQLIVSLRLDKHLLHLSDNHRVLLSDNHLLYPSDNHLLLLSDKHHLHLSDNHLLHLIYKIIQMMLKLLYATLLQLHFDLFLLDNPTMIRLCMLHHDANNPSSIHLLLLVDMNLLLFQKLLQWHSSILYHLLFHVLQTRKILLL
jgi:hypothetical protein